MKILITGALGFIGSNFVRYLDRMGEGHELYLVDSEKIGSTRALLKSFPELCPRFSSLDIYRQSNLLGKCLKDIEPDIIVNFAAESHVDRSIEGPLPFTETNAVGVHKLLEIVRKATWPVRFVQISTDEVYGELESPERATESSALWPSSPYSASKTAGDLMVQAYVRTYGIDAVITRCTNNFGPWQFPEKLIPVVITKALFDKKIPVYGNGQQQRDWIFVDDHCAAIDAVMCRGKSGRVYNVGTETETTNIDLIHTILDIMGKPRDLIEFVKDRPGHDRRYAVGCGLIEHELGWRPSADFKLALQNTVEWYVRSTDWWMPLIKKETK